MTTAERPSLETPDVRGPGLVPAVGLGPKVTFTKSEIKVDDHVVATLGPDGLIDSTRLIDADSRAREQGDERRAGRDRARRHAAVSPRRHAARYAATRRLSQPRVARREQPADDPARAAGQRGGQRGRAAPVVTLDGKRLTLWSASGEEGTKRKPKLVLDVGPDASFAPLTRALAEIVQKRWPDGKRRPADRTIIVQLDGKQPARVMLNLLVAVRADGPRELFPNIFLAGGL